MSLYVPLFDSFKNYGCLKLVNFSMVMLAWMGLDSVLTCVYTLFDHKMNFKQAFIKKNYLRIFLQLEY